MPSRSGSEAETDSSACNGCGPPAVCAGAVTNRPVTSKEMNTNRWASKGIAELSNKVWCEAIIPTAGRPGRLQKIYRTAKQRSDILCICVVVANPSIGVLDANQFSRFQDHTVDRPGNECSAGVAGAFRQCREAHEDCLCRGRIYTRWSAGTIDHPRRYHRTGLRDRLCNSADGSS